MANKPFSSEISGVPDLMVDMGDGTFSHRVVAQLKGGPVVYTDRSNTITLGATAQTLAAANASRTGLWVQNLSTGDLWISSIGTAGPSQPSMWLPAGSYYEFPATAIPTTAISIFGATTGQAFAAREW